MSSARDLLVTQKIDSSEYQIMKSEYGEVIISWRINCNTFQINKQSIEVLLDRGIDKLLRLNKAFEDGALAEARELIGLIFPENFT